jgi:hypothetical protein
MKIKLITLLTATMFLTLAMSAQYENRKLGGFNYTADWERRVASPITRLRASDAELAASAGLFALGIILPRIDKSNQRQGAEIACFTFSLTLFVEGLRMRSNIKDKRNVRYWSRKKIPAAKY